MPRYALHLAYDGSDFHGWWRQPGLRTVAGVLDEAFARLDEPTAATVGAARTDAGVHALAQTAHVDLSREWEPARLLMALANHLPGDCACLAIAPVAADWHACHGTLAKTYRYRIDNGPLPDPFLSRQAWRPPYRLDLEALVAAALPLPGRRDWGGFVRRGETRDDLVRTITTVHWTAPGQELWCEVSGDGFAYHLVRSLVGAMVAVAQGTCTAAELLGSLAGNRTPAGSQQSPAKGLWLIDTRHRQEPDWIRPRP